MRGPRNPYDIVGQSLWINIARYELTNINVLDAELTVNQKANELFRDALQKVKVITCGTRKFQLGR